MEARTLTRPAATLASLLRHQTTVVAVPCRGHKTASRTKRALNIPPHPDFIPPPHVSSNSGGGSDTIVYNPPSAAPSVFHTPFKFLPATDPRRRANLSSFFPGAASDASASAPSPSSKKSKKSATPLPPALNVPSRGAKPRYHLTREHVEQMRELRAKDPVRWSVSALARKFKCSEVFVTACAPASREHKERLARKLDAVKDTWGAIRTKAREERTRRKEMLFRGEL